LVGQPGQRRLDTAAPNLALFRIGGVVAGFFQDGHDPVGIQKRYRPRRLRRPRRKPGAQFTLTERVADDRRATQFPCATG